MLNKLIEIETERLRLRQWKESDFEIYSDYYSNEKLAQYVGGKMDKEMAWRKMVSLIIVKLRTFPHWLKQILGFFYPFLLKLMPKIP